MSLFVRLHILVVLFTILPFVSFSQDIKKKKDPAAEEDSTFIAHYPQYISLAIYTTSPVMQLVIDPAEDALKKYKSDFKGNFSDQLGVSFAYRSLYIHYAFRTPIGPGIDNARGKSASTGITLRIRKPKLFLSAEYRRYTGYYDSNTDAYAPGDAGRYYYIRPDIHYKNIGVNGIYNFSWKKYSYTAPLMFTERQLRSRLGFLVKAGLNYTTIYSSDSTLLTSAQTGQLTSYSELSSIHAVLMKAGPGVGLNLVVFKRFYFAMNYFIMGNFIEYQFDTQTNGYSSWHDNWNFYTETSTGFGYNSKRMFAGINFNGDINIIRVQGAFVKTNFASVTMTLGYRFGAPEFFRKGWENTLTKYLKL